MAEIIINDRAPRETYTVGNTPEQVFAVPFPFFANSDLRVYVGGERIDLGADYTVIGAGQPSGGTVALEEAVSNTSVTIARRIPIDRLTDFPAAGGFKVPALNRELDRMTAIAQQIADDAARAIRPPDSDGADMDGTLPPAADRADRALGFDDDGNPRASNVTFSAIEAVTTGGIAAGKVIADCPPVTSDGSLTSIDTGYQIASAAQVVLTIGGIEQRNNYTVAGSVVSFAAVPAGVTAHVRILGVSPDAPGAGDVSYLPALPLAEEASGGSSPNSAAVDHAHPLPTAAEVGAQPLDATLTDLAARTIGAGSSTSILDRAAGDARFAALVHAHAQSDITGLAAALALLAPLASPALTGTPTAPTATLGTNTTQVATTAFVAAAVAALVNSSPSALDTLNELAAALGNDANFSTTVTNALANKQPLDATLTALAGVITSANKLIYATGSDTFATTDLSAFARSLLDDADAATALATLGAAALAGATFSGYVRGNTVALTDAATITPDMAAGNRFSVTLGGNRTLANPSNLTAGQSGCIIIRQDGTGSRTLSYGSYWKFQGGTVPTLSTTASRVDRLQYDVVSTTEIHATLLKDFR